MTSTDHPVDQVLRRLAPQVTTGGVHNPHHPTARQLRTAITSASLDARPLTPAAPVRQVRHRRTRRLVLFGAPAAVAAGAAAAVLAAVVLSPSSPSGPRPAQADVLDITTEGDLVVARVSDPTADPARYAAEFAERGLDVDLRLVPASPTVVGTVVMLEADPDVGVVEAPEQCETPGGARCPVGIRIPADHRGHVEVVFGRAAEPGEHYESSNKATAAGEALAGLDLTGRPVSDVLDILVEHGQQASQFRTTSASSGVTRDLSADQVPGDWYVHSVDLWAPGEVILFVGETAEPVPPPLPPGAVPPTSAPADQAS